MITRDDIRPFLHTTLGETQFEGIGEKYAGKVRDVYVQGDNRILIATDRQSAFDISWCEIPLKGQVLNQTSAWWFSQIEDILPTHVVDVPDPNVMRVKSLKIIPIEVVVRAYLTGSSKTAIWVNYNNGVRDYCGHTLPDGMVKNEALSEVMVTPTTKGEDDELISGEQIVSQGIATAEQWNEMESKALEVFARGQKLAAERGLILVDTKYEMGLDEDGNIVMADEVHTPDSSRYWIADSYESRFSAGQEPDSLDKEFFRLWLREQGFEYGGKHPEITDEVRIDLALKYIELYERVTGEQFIVPQHADVAARIQSNLL